MELQQMKYFVAVAENLNFTRAARKCYISQTAMSLQIKALEKELGTSLFVRDRHHVELTRAGKVFLQQVKPIIAQSQKAIRLTKSAATGIDGTLRIGYVQGYEQTLFSETLRSYHDANPGVHISLGSDNASVLCPRLINGDFDIVFNVNGGTDSREGLSYRHLCSYNLMAVLPLDHPLCEDDRLTYADLKDYGHIILEKDTVSEEQSDVVRVYRQRGGYTPTIAAIESDLDTLLLMVSAGLGIAVLPEYSVKFFPEAKNLEVKTLYDATGKEESLDFGAYWRLDDTNHVIGPFLHWIDRHGSEGFH